MKNKTNRSKRERARSSYRAGFKQSNSDMAEFGKGKQDIALCPRCNAVYYYKSWHHDMLAYPFIEKKKQVHFVECPACGMWGRHQWEGEVRISGIPAGMYEQVINTVLSIADEAYRRDPMHRIFDIKKKGRVTAVYVSENQLAVRIAKKVVSSLKKHISKPVIRHGKGGDAVLITMQWLE